MGVSVSVSVCVLGDSGNTPHAMIEIVVQRDIKENLCKKNNGHH